jgi:transducin (beta)-like 1
MISDYQETAAKLQKEWDKPDPDQLPFASHVQIHALVSTVNRGLLYNVQERDPALVRSEYDHADRRDN